MDIRPDPQTRKRADFENILDQSELSSAVEGVNGIIHLAAVSRVIDAERNPPLCYKTNIIGLKNLITATRKQEDKPWIIFASSREIYGEPKSFPVNEDHPLQPINYYGRCKQTAEAMLQGVAIDGITSVILRLSNVYGSAYDHPTRVIPAFLTGALKRTVLRVDSSEHVFDFTHVKDVTAALTTVAYALITSKLEQNTIFNLSPGKGTSLLQLVDYIREITGKNIETVNGGERNYDVSRYIGDSTKIWKGLGFRCKIDIKEGLRLLQDEYLATWRSLS